MAGIAEKSDLPARVNPSFEWFAIHQLPLESGRNERKDFLEPKRAAASE